MFTVQADRPVRMELRPGSMAPVSPAKPTYRVPSMVEIESIPSNGFDVVSTFSGCGGSCLGYRMAGFHVLWASEFVPTAQAVYRANHPGTILDTRDIRQVKPEEILRATGKAVDEIDLLDGSPPCASFSTAGKRQAGWGQVKAYSDTKQRTDDLFFEYARLVDGLRPKTFVAENVSGLIKGSAKGYFLEILRALKAAGGGYRVEAKVLDAQWLGVPQMRQRLIFVGVRADLGLAPAFPKPLGYRYSVREALPWIRQIEVRNGVYSPASIPARTVRQSDGGRSTTSLEIDSGYVEAESRMDSYAIGREWDRTAPGNRSKAYQNLMRPHPDRPSYTVTAEGGVSSKASVTHPTERRKFSIAELKRICAFPDDFVLNGTYSQNWERLGRAVPPVMMSHIASAVRDGVLCRIKSACP